jgi:hypothetical protein
MSFGWESPDNPLSRCAYWGDGVYKSTDGASPGRTWARATQHIARIVIHPSNPDIVWVAALSHLGTPNNERGVFKDIRWRPHVAEAAICQ